MNFPRLAAAGALWTLGGGREFSNGDQASPEGVLPGKKSVRVLRLEDGFLRSVGLGADLVRPLSWVIDSRGIYYDATAPSDLEYLLKTTTFSEDLLGRAARLRERIVKSGLTKYNVDAARRWHRPFSRNPQLEHSPAGAGELPAGEGEKSRDSQPGGKGKQVLLVPGQVETDASLAFGAPGVRHNMELLRAVREANPNAYLVYKPHPDVHAGLRSRGLAEDQASIWCDEQVVGVGMGDLLPQVDEVHVLTSLAGFEALLRDKPVTCYGQPFYAGWGLTKDMLPPVRRTRRLSLDELVAGTLILYPSYVSRVTGRFTTPERALDELQAWREEKNIGVTTWWRGLLRLLLRMRAR